MKWRENIRVLIEEAWLQPENARHVLYKHFTKFIFWFFNWYTDNFFK